MKKTPNTYRRLLNKLEGEVRKLGKFEISQKDFDIYAATLKSSFVKAYDFAKIAHRTRFEAADEVSFFMTAGLRGICEDIIALKFVAQLPTAVRQELVTLEMSTSLGKAVDAQTRFFKSERDFQPVVTPVVVRDVNKEKLQYSAIGLKAGLPMIKDKLPAVEQMAIAVGLRDVYDYFYRVTSETVHFNVHVALRNGWGTLPGVVQFGTKSFCKYYLSVNQIYGVFLFCLMAETFLVELGLSRSFLDIVTNLRNELNRELRWPEPVTFEELNINPPSPILTVALLMDHLEKTDPEYIDKLRKKTKRSKAERSLKLVPRTELGPGSTQLVQPSRTQ